MIKNAVKGSTAPSTQWLMNSSHTFLIWKSISRLESKLTSTTRGIPFCANPMSAFGLNMSDFCCCKEDNESICNRMRWCNFAHALPPVPDTWEKSSVFPAWTKLASKGASCSFSTSKFLIKNNSPSSRDFSVVTDSPAFKSDSLQRDTASWARSSNTPFYRQMHLSTWTTAKPPPSTHTVPEHIDIALREPIMSFVE